MLIDFEKWHGCRNDFLLVKLAHDDTLIHSLQKAAPRLCTRDGSGIGADGIIALAYAPSSGSSESSLDPDAVYIINSDGSLAANCGNGLRCAAMSLYFEAQQRGLTDEQPHFSFPIVNELGKPSCHTVAADIISPAEGSTPLVALMMGVPEVGEDWPQFGEARDTVHKAAERLDLPWLTQSFGAGSIGNPHIVVWTEEENLRYFEQVGAELQAFDGGAGINAHLAAERPATTDERREGQRLLGAAIDSSFEIKIYERGAGVTPACGSGACMVAAIAWSSDLEDRSQWLRVVMPGGTVYLQQPAKDEPVRMAGPAEVVFRGVLNL